MSDPVVWRIDSELNRRISVVVVCGLFSFGDFRKGKGADIGRDFVVCFGACEQDQATSAIPRVVKLWPSQPRSEFEFTHRQRQRKVVLNAMGV